MKIGLVSDTHGYFDPRLKDVLAGVDVVLHAGDVGEDAVLDDLREIAPVHAVRGNVDSPASGLSLTLDLTFQGAAIHLVHILPASQSHLEAWAQAERESRPIPAPAQRLVRAFGPATEAVLFGHTHCPLLECMGGVLWINPGSAGRKRFRLPRTCGLLEVSANDLAVGLVSLEDNSGRLPAPISVRRRLL